MLVVATLVWGLGFPLGKAALAAQESAAPGVATLALTCALLGIRFLLSLPPQFLAHGPRPDITRREWHQGFGVGMFGGLGILLQTDALSYTSASTAAFLTQGYCVWIPIVLALRERRAPGGRTALAVFCVVTGAGILSGVSPSNLRLGRGELEVLAASVLFTGQILWLDDPRFAGNRMDRVSTVMFLVVTLLYAAPLVASGRAGLDALTSVAASPAMVATVTVLALVSTWLPFRLMNAWQPKVDPTRAGLIYCAEPVFGSLFALCVPAWVSPALGIEYPNETPGFALLAGGGLILAANLLVLPPKTS